MVRLVAPRRVLSRVIACQALAALMLVTDVRAQGAPPANPATPAAEVFRFLQPGDSLLRGTRVATGTFRHTLTAYRDADEFPVGRIQDEIAIDTVNGMPRLRRVQTLQRGTQRIVDSSFTNANTLAPVWHHSEQPTRRITIDFAGRKVKALVGLPDASPAVIDTTVQRPPFDSGNWDLLLRALPLEKGLRVRFLVYDTDAGVHEYRFSVTGSTTVQGEEAHVVTFQLSRTSDAIVWVGKTSGAILQMETMLAGNTLLRQVRVPASVPR